ncbi:hypothetical protein HNY73_006377 [Argiope bruennichi]|uniref:Uncharacterized protein n=1 Tax=Argiope bruennichi TaxID=94029 RepID=A0A8T0FKQ3_ARGBR|nr:hypothetical protein HNY73_006377 [Argiope bruennichi]
MNVIHEGTCDPCPNGNHRMGVPIPSEVHHANDSHPHSDTNEDLLRRVQGSLSLRTDFEFKAISDKTFWEITRS